MAPTKRAMVRSTLLSFTFVTSFTKAKPSNTKSTPRIGNGKTFTASKITPPKKRPKTRKIAP